MASGPSLPPELTDVPALRSQNPGFTSSARTSCMYYCGPVQSSPGLPGSVCGQAGAISLIQSRIFPCESQSVKLRKIATVFTWLVQPRALVSTELDWLAGRWSRETWPVLTSLYFYQTVTLCTMDLSQSVRVRGGYSSEKYLSLHEGSY